MKTTIIHTMLRTRAVGAALLLAIPVVTACRQDDPPAQPSEELYVEPDVEPEAVQSRFRVEIDTAHADLERTLLDPIASPVTITGDGGELALSTLVKRVARREGLVWIELHVENVGETGLGRVALRVDALQGTSDLYDFTRDPFTDATAEREFPVGGIVKEGIGRVALGVPQTGGVVSFEVVVSGVRTDRTASNSQPIVVTPDGAEVWAVVPDADVVAVIDTATDQRVGQVEVAGRPASLASTTDGAFLLVASRDANTVTVIDRERREVVQIFAEEDGIGRDPRHIVMSPDGSRAFVSAYVSDSLTEIVRYTDRFEVGRTLAVGRRPNGLSVTPDGATLLVARYMPEGTAIENSSWISVVDIESFALRNEIELYDILNLDRAHCLADVFGVSAQRMTSEGVPNQLETPFLNPSGTRAWLPHAQTAGAPVMERGPDSAELDPSFETRPGEIVPAFISLIDARDPGAIDRMINPGGVERPTSYDYLSCAKISASIEFASNAAIPGQPDQRIESFAAMPTGMTGLESSGHIRSIGFSRGGRRALAVSYVSDLLFVIDETTGHQTAQRGLVLEGANPSGIAVTLDGHKAYVAYENDMFASVLDLGAYADPGTLPRPTFVPYEYREVPEVTGGSNGLSTERLVRYVGELPERPALSSPTRVSLVDEDPMDPVLRRGKILFTSSNNEKYPQLSETTMTSCASCHPAGGNDGSAWTTMEGERRTMSLFGGVRSRGWLHSTATHRDIHEFAGSIIAERLGGAPSAADVDAVATYVADGIPRLQTPTVDEALASRGEELFGVHCTSCHQGEQLTSGAPTNDPWGAGSTAGPGLYDVGSATDDAHVGLPTFFESLFPMTEASLLKSLRGDRDLGDDDPIQALLDFRPRPNRARGLFKAPPLVNVWDNVVFFHDGRYDDLGDVVRHFDDHLSLGLTDADVEALVEYLKTL